MPQFDGLTQNELNFRQSQQKDRFGVLIPLSNSGHASRTDFTCAAAGFFLISKKKDIFHRPKANKRRTAKPEQVKEREAAQETPSLNVRGLRR
jgi:hypothetical protein